MDNKERRKRIKGFLGAAGAVAAGAFLSWFFNMVYLPPEAGRFIIAAAVVFTLWRFFEYEPLLLGFVFLIPYNLYFFDLAGQYTVSFLHLILLAVFLKFAEHRRFWKNPVSLLRDFPLPILLYIILTGVSLLWSVDRGVSLRTALRWLVPAASFLFGYRAAGRRLRARVVKTAVLSGLILILFTAGQWVWGLRVERPRQVIREEFAKESSPLFIFIDSDRLRDERVNWLAPGGDIRAFGTFANANNLAGFLGLIFFLIYTLKVFREKNKLYLDFLPPLIFGLVLMMTGSKTGLLAFALSLPVFLAFKGKGRWKRLAVYAALIAVIAVIFHTRVIPVRGFDRTESGFRWRVNQSRDAVEYIIENPFGTGLGTYPDILPHNIFITAGLFLGFAGVGVFLWMFFYIFAGGIRKFRGSSDPYGKRLALCLLCGFLWFIIHAQADNFNISDNVGMLFWLQAGMLLSREKSPELKEAR